MMGFGGILGGADRKYSKADLPLELDRCLSSTEDGLAVRPILPKTVRS